MSDPSGQVRRGRRPIDAHSRQDILIAARRSFATAGYSAVSLRAIAREAGVDPRVVHHFFESKSDLFAEVIGAAPDVPALMHQVLSGPRELVGERLTREILRTWGAREVRDSLTARVGWAADSAEGAQALREFLVDEVFKPMVQQLGVSDSLMRSNLVSTQVLGLIMARFVLRLEPIASAEVDRVVGWVGPVLQRYLVGEP